MNARRWRAICFVAMVGLLIAWGIRFRHYVWALLAWGVDVPLAELVVSPDLEKADSVPATAGALRGYDVVLVTLDTTRPDRLGCYGNVKAATPNVDRLAREGVIFSSALAVTPLTLPSHASMLTGLYPQHHGARVNSRYRLAEGSRTLAEILASAGYATGAFVSSFVLDGRLGLAQGFGTYDSHVGASPALGAYPDRKANDTTDLAIRWLGEQGPEPFFLWVHYYDAHAPYEPPSPYKEAAANLYDGELAFVDHEMGRLVQAIEASGRRTLIAVLADHGEALGEHGEITHGLLLQEATLRIPLILWASGGLGRGVHVDQRVSQVDLTPTILALIGIDAPADLDGVSLLQAPDAERALMAEAAEGWAEYGWGRLSALYKDSLKYVEGPHPQLYDLARDPLERDDVAAARSADALKYRWLLRQREGENANHLGDSGVELAEADIQRLVALGYVVGGTAANAEAATGPDPNAMVPPFVQMQQLVTAYQDYPKMPRWLPPILSLLGRTVVDDRTDLIEKLERLAAEHPDFAPVHQYLATFYAEQHRPEDAARARAQFDTMTGRRTPPILNGDGSS